MKFHIYKNSSGEFQWRLVSSNGKIIADSAEGYKDKADCQHGIDLIKKDAASAQVEEASA